MLSSRLSMCVCAVVWLSVCVCCEEGNMSDKWLSFGPGELFTNSCFIFSAQEERCVYVLVWKRERERETDKKN